MTTKHRGRPAGPAPIVAEKPDAEPCEEEALATLVPSAVEPEPEPEPALGPEPEPAPTGAEDEIPPEGPRPDPGAQPLAKEYVVLSGPASYGPVRIGGQKVRALKDKLYYVPHLEERAEILGSGRFRAAIKADLARAGSPSAGPGGAITRDLLPPGAIKGGLQQ